MVRFFNSQKATLGFSLLFLLNCSSVFTDDGDKKTKQMRLVLQSMKDQHFVNPSVDDSFSKKVFKLYLEQMDHSKRFYTQQDSLALASYFTKIDDQLNANQFEFFEKANTLYETRLQSVNGFYKSMLESPMDFSKDEFIQLDPEKRPFAKDESELKDQWRKYLKYLVLNNVQIKLEQQEKSKDSIKIVKPFDTLEVEARKKILKDHEDMFKRLLRETKEERFDDFINAVVHAYDPHSDFFPPKEKENFDIQMSGKLEGIGATLQEKDGYIKVISIVPGSPSFKQGELKPEDYILKVGQGEEEPVDIVDMRLDNAVKLIRGKKGTTVKLTIKKPDGKIKVISIVRDVVVMEESYAKSVIINDEVNKQKIGYINLPSFYADFNDRKGRTCSEDIRKELIKLKAEQVDGIVLDLRNNGGGSLSDVVTMGGYFIDQGPIVQVKAREDEPYILADENSGTIYDGPLVILVNHFSASASEILAAAMQDYKRAVIIGSSSFGKGTVQRFFELAGDPVNGSIKITTQKFYRVNGGTTQLKGVIPDIVLPDVYQDLDIGEKELDYALAWDEIKASQYNSWNAKFKMKDIQSKSKARVEKNEVFKKIKTNAQYLKTKQASTYYPLSLKAYQAEMIRSKKEEESYKIETSDISGISIEALKPEKALLADTNKLARHNEFIKPLKKDIYLFEAIQVIKDLR
ncbi:MAG: carboxy terminal-processing peptidase [Cytophagaceae bacterium]|nr:carboxy terminal-processing peptidase [Cytophagaceae bacterium]